MLPLPKPISVMTAAMPMMMPSTERMERSLCSQRLRKASTKLLRHFIQATAISVVRVESIGRILRRAERRKPPVFVLRTDASISR